MVDHSNHYLFTKRGTYYYSRRVPAAVCKQFGKHRFVRCLHTSNRGKAERLSLELSSRLENIWDRLRLDLVTFNQIIEPRGQNSSAISLAPKAASAGAPTAQTIPTIGDALDLYIRLKSPGKGELF